MPKLAQRQLPVLKNKKYRDESLDIVHLPDRPKTRADCVNGPRPCPWVGCRYHLYLDVNPSTGSIRFNFPRENPEDLEHSCVLDLAESCIELKHIAELFNISKQRVHQIENKALDKFKKLVPKHLLDLVK